MLVNVVETAIAVLSMLLVVVHVLVLPVGQVSKSQSRHEAAPLALADANSSIGGYR